MVHRAWGWLVFHAHGDGNGRGGEGRDMLAAESRFRIFYFNLFYIVDELVMQCIYFFVVCLLFLKADGHCAVEDASALSVMVVRIEAACEVQSDRNKTTQL